MCASASPASSPYISRRPSHTSTAFFEHVYFARTDSKIFGRSVNASREMLGRLLAKEYPVDADLIVPVPDSGVPAAVGYAMESGISVSHGL